MIGVDAIYRQYFSDITAVATIINMRPVFNFFRSASGPQGCLLYTSDAADDMQCVDLGGRRIIKKSSAYGGGVFSSR